tara:strand:- start:5512 stop:7233 length:1722 start_codon:yes stop_codon:yes gene_type:complete
MKNKKNRKKNKLSLESILFESMMEGVMITDIDGIIEIVNPAFTVITGYSNSESIGKKSSFLKSDRHDEKFFRNMWDSLLAKGHWKGNIWNRRKNGEAYLTQLTITALKDSENKTIKYSSVFHDITDVKQSEENLKRQAHYDALTGLPNRPLFFDRLKEAVARSHRNKHKFAVMFLDLDNFKNVNDVLGHATGDLLLKEAATRLMDCIREVDTIARLGGDEFIIILENLKKELDAAAISRKIIGSLSSPFSFKGEDLFVSSSIGISLYPADATTVEDLMKYADMAMYHAKELGRGNYQFFTQTMNDNVLKRLNLEKNLRNALAMNEFIAHYQPIVDLKNGQIVAMEALMRWQRPDGSLTSPDNFIPLAEETGLIVKLDEWMLQKACDFARKLQKTNSTMPPVSVNVSVNLSAIVLERKDLAEMVGKKVQEAGLQPKHVKLEVTESSVIRNIDLAINTLQKLLDVGFNISMDDFGTGYSSLSCLKKLPINILKIDRSFVVDLPSDPNARSIAKAIITMAHDMNIKVIAEGVENQAQLDFFRTIGCDEIQGFFFSPPLPQDKMEEMLEKGKTLFLR